MDIEKLLLAMLVEDQHKIGNNTQDTQSLLWHRASDFDIELSDDLLDYVDMLYMNIENNNGAYDYKASPFVL
jgi:hypothetical protein